MTLSEFRSWLDGFSEAIDGAPSAEQWEKIKAKLATVSDGYIYTPDLSPIDWDLRIGDTTPLAPSAFGDKQQKIAPATYIAEAASGKSLLWMTS